MPGFRIGRGNNLRCIGFRLLLAVFFCVITAIFLAHHAKVHKVFDDVVSSAPRKKAYCEGLEVSTFAHTTTIRFKMLMVFSPPSDADYPIIRDDVFVWLYVKDDRRFNAGKGPLRRNHFAETFHEVGPIFVNYINVTVRYVDWMRSDPIILKTFYTWSVSSNVSGPWVKRTMKSSTELICDHP